MSACVKDPLLDVSFKLERTPDASARNPFPFANVGDFALPPGTFGCLGFPSFFGPFVAVSFGGEACLFGF